MKILNLRDELSLDRSRMAVIMLVTGLAMVIFSILSCQQPYQAPAPTPAPAPLPIPPPATPAPPALPQPDGAAVYQYITEMDNYKDWQMWPGLGALYSGRSSAHAPVLTTYVSDNVRTALDGDGDIPDRGIIIKENYNEAKELQALTVMYRVQGYDPQHDDFFWGYYGADGSIINEGKIDSCISCHDLAKNRPYIWNDSPAVMLLSSPQDGATLDPGNITVTVGVFNFLIADKLGATPVSGEGHIHYYLDADIPTTPGQPAVTEPGTYKAYPGTSMVWENVTPGEHTLGVQLVNNNHTPLDPPVTAAVMVIVESPAEQLMLDTKEGIGQYLTDSSGMTLYYFTQDLPGRSNYTGQCLDFWPLFQAEEVITPSGLAAADFGAITRDDGQKQATYRDWPLYYYANDEVPGDTSGEDSRGVWYVIKEPFYNVMIMTSETLGNYLADAEGMTLYLFANDYASQSNWTGAAWPTFYTENIIATSNLNPDDFGTITRDDGDKQTTYKGWPLYYFANDTAPGDATGEGVNEVWFTLGEDIEAASQPPAPAGNDDGGDVVY